MTNSSGVQPLSVNVEKYSSLKERDFMRALMVILEVSTIAAFSPNFVKVMF